MAAFPGSSTSCRCDLIEFFHPSLLDRYPLVAVRYGSNCFLEIVGQLRDRWNPVPYAACTFLYAYRILHLDSGKYRNILRCLGISQSGRCMESRAFGKGEFMASIGDCQLSYSSDVKAS